MIKAVRSTNKKFKTVTFSNGFNVVLAERDKGATEKDSRNGLGKSTLIEIIHFCLGAGTKVNAGLRVDELKDWTFILDLTLNGKDYSVHRNTTNYNFVEIEGDFTNWPIMPTKNPETGKFVLKNSDWVLVLGLLMFNLPPMETERKYSPSFRALISYFIRKGVSAFNNPFEYFSDQKEWEIQVYNSYLLGLNWEYAADLQLIKDREKTLQTLKEAASQGLLTGFLGSQGELEAEKVRLQEECKIIGKELKSFNVHPEYTRIQEEANKLTEEIHGLANDYTIKQQVLNKYEQSMVQEQDIALDKVRNVYEDAGLVFSTQLVKQLEDVSEFHKIITENRKTYLDTEINRISRSITEDLEKIQNKTNERAELLSVLETHGALEEYTLMQNRHSRLKQNLEEVEKRIENYKRFQSMKSTLKIEKEELLQKMRQDYEERKAQIEQAISLFNKNSTTLYSDPGILSIDITESGYKFKIEIRRAQSQGVGYMKTFTYDLTLTDINVSKHKNPADVFLIHDSTIFDGVDERQIARAMELAALSCEEHGFQYICTMNSDMVPRNDFSDEFGNDFDKKYVRAVFTDATEDGGILGFRF